MEKQVLQKSFAQIPKTKGNVKEDVGIKEMLNLILEKPNLFNRQDLT